MAKRRNENGQMRREDYEAGDNEESADSCETGFQRASESKIRTRKIVKARTGSRPAVRISKSKATTDEDTAAKSNPFCGFQGLTAVTSTATNAVDQSSGLTADKADSSMTSNGSSVTSVGSYQQAMERLNKDFLAFVTSQLQTNPSASWTAAVQEYLNYAAEIATKYVSTRPVAISETKPIVPPAPFPVDATSAPAPRSNAIAAPSNMSPSLDGSNVGAKTKNETPAHSGFSLGVVGKKDDKSTGHDTGGLSFGGTGSSLFTAKPSDEVEKTTSAFSFGAPPKPVVPVVSSSSDANGVSFGNADAFKSIAPSSGLNFGTSAASTSMSTTAGDEEEEHIGREEATVIIKADACDDDCTFEADKVKIFELKKDEKRWADKGVHPLKILISKETNSARILVRNAIGKVVLNAALYKGMTVRPHETKGKKTGVTLALQIDSTLTHFLLKVNAARVDELIKALESAASSS